MRYDREAYHVHKVSNQTWGQIHWNVFKYKYFWGIQIQILLNANVFKYKYFWKVFQILFIFRIYYYIGKRNKTIHQAVHLVYCYCLSCLVTFSGLVSIWLLPSVQCSLKIAEFTISQSYTAETSAAGKCCLLVYTFEKSIWKVFEI